MTWECENETPLSAHDPIAVHAHRIREALLIVLHRANRGWRRAVLQFWCVALVACSPAAPLPRGSSTSTPATPPTTRASVAGSIVDLTNRERSIAGVPALAREARLMQAAQIHADQMAAAKRMDHVLEGARYPTLVTRLAAVGYRYGATAENISWNQPTANAAVAGWIRSAGHRTNMLSTLYTEMGAGYATDASGQSYYVQVFGIQR